MQAKIDTSADGRRIIKVTFQRQAPDSNAPWVEAVYYLYWPEDFSLKGDPFVLMPLSSTRIDTREPVTLTREEINATLEAAVVRAATECQEW